MQKDCGLGVLPLTMTNLMGDSTRSIGLVGGNTDSLVLLTAIFLVCPFSLQVSGYATPPAPPLQRSRRSELGTASTTSGPKRSAHRREPLKQIWPELASRILPWLGPTCGIPRQSVGHNDGGRD